MKRVCSKNYILTNEEGYVQNTTYLQMKRGMFKKTTYLQMMRGMFKRAKEGYDQKT